MMTAHATVIYTLDTINTAGFGPAPYGTVAVTLTNPTTAQITFNNAPPYTFGEMGLNVNATSFSADGLSFVLAPTSNQTPTFSIDIGGQLDGFGNFALDYVSTPAGFSASLSSATFTLHDLSGTWTESTVLIGNSDGHEVAAHVFNAATGGNSAFAAGGPTTNPPPVPEPASLAMLGVSALMLRRRRVK